MKYLWSIIVLFSLAACSTADTTGNVRKYDINVRISGTGNELKMTMPVTASTDMRLDPANTSSNDTSPSTSLGLNGGTASTAAQGAEMALSEISSIAKRWIDQRKKDSENTTTTTTDSNNRVDDSVNKQPAVVPVTPTEPTSPATPEQPTEPTGPSEPAQPGQPTAGKHTKTFDMRWVAPHNRSFTWLELTGKDYGGPVDFAFNNDCGTLHVADPTQNYNQTSPAARYFDGTHNKPDESNGNRSSVFSRVGCNASKVTLTW